MGDLVGGEFARKVAEELDLKFHPIERRTFPDTEVQPWVKIQGELSDEIHFILRPKKDQNFNSYLVEFLVTLRNLKNRVEEVHAVMPYLLYARQDKEFRKGEPVSSKIIADLIERAGADSFTSITVHIHRTESIDNLFDIEAYNLSGFPLLARYAKQNYKLNDPFVLAPDDEALKWAKEVSKVLNADYDSIHKERDVETGEIKTKMPEVDLKRRDVIIIDDMIATGGTMISAIKKARKAGAKGVIACAVHPVLVEGAPENLKELDLKGLFTANTLPSVISKADVRSLIIEHIKQH